ncbi:MAG: hypothetical protein JW751_25180 [Polyangiaceae bacterium]|nr:hypothetical protein [Polyangiaceae bacterium]
MQRRQSETAAIARGLGAVAVAAAVLASNREAQGAAPKLLVFLHVALKQRALQTEFGAALSGIEVTAVGRIADFDRALATGQDAVLTLPVVLDARGLSPGLRGHRAGAPDEVYALVGADSPPDPARVKTVGALDLLGRNDTTAFVHRVVGGVPAVERVTKIEDLLALLQMQRADAILLALRLVPEVKTMTRLNLQHRELGSRIGLPAASSVGPGGGRVLAAIDKLPQGLSRTVGVDEWR